MADTQRDGRDGRTNGGSADRPDRGRRSGCRPGAVAGGKPGGMAARSHNGRACSGHGSGFSCWGCWTTFPSCRRAPVRPVVAGSKHPEVHLRLSENGSVEPSFVMRPWAMVVTSLRPDGWKRLTTRHGSRSRQRGPDVGSVRIEFHLRPCIDAKRSNRAGKSLASGGRRRPALQEARAGPGLAWWFGVEPPPESNRRPHPYHGTTRNRCANRRSRRSRPTVRTEVIGSSSAKLCAHFSHVLLYGGVVAAPAEAPVHHPLGAGGGPAGTPLPPPGRPGRHLAQILAEELATP
jgi:hypothetical protein